MFGSSIYGSGLRNWITRHTKGNVIQVCIIYVRIMYRDKKTGKSG